MTHPGLPTADDAAALDRLIEKARTMQAKAEACPLHEWEVYESRIEQGVGSLACKHCGMRVAAHFAALDPRP